MDPACVATGENLDLTKYVHAEDACPKATALVAWAYANQTTKTLQYNNEGGLYFKDRVYQ